jgi:predicted DNA binding CopG/RHH family protein
MLKIIPEEQWKKIRLQGGEGLKKKYTVSDFGRLASYDKKVTEDGKILKGSVTTGYKSLNLHVIGTKSTIYVHREVAKLFSKKPSSKHIYVIHLNHNKLDNHIDNLKWSTLSEMSAHQQGSPAKIAYKKIQANRKVGLKLDTSQVKAIKKMLSNPKRKITIQQIAAKYEVSEMTIYRIRSGENWGNIKMN